MLKRFKHEQEQKLAVRGKKVDLNDRIFTRPQDDEPWTMEFIQTHFKKAVQVAELPNIRLHDLRHTFATLLLQHYLPQKVQRLMGHSSIQTTIDIYGHAIPGDSLELTQGFDEAIKDALEQVSERELQLI
jgi:integrase